MSEPVDDVADLIEPFSRRGVDLGLERLQAALAELGHPERQFSAVQVAGTNGKGSICTLVHQALLAADINAGLYTSPHLVSWTERIRIGATCIAPGALRRHLLVASSVAKAHGLTPFELVTAAAFLAFAEAGLPLVVLEVGLGGRLDATSCHPDRGVIGMATLGLDHCDYLGPDLASIAAEKAGVLQPGCVAISGPQEPEVAAMLEARAAAVGAALHWVAPLERSPSGELRLATNAPDGTGSAGDPGAAATAWSPCGLPGAVQAVNAAVAQGVLQALAQRDWPIDAAAIRRGFAAARWPGRLQQVNWHGIPLLLDGAHNPPAAKALRAELDAQPERHGLAPGRRHWLIGMLANKEGPEILRTLLSPGDQAWIVPVPGHASWSRDQLAAQLLQQAESLQQVKPLQQDRPAHLIAQLNAPSPCAVPLRGGVATLHEADDLPQALQALRAAALADTQRVVVTGSLYLIGTLLAQL